MDSKVKRGLGVAALLGAIATLGAIFSDPRKKVIKVALKELGDQNPDKYWKEVSPTLMGAPTKISWCGGFALWVLRHAGLTDIMWVPGEGFASKYLRITKEPKAGDIAYFDQPYQHHAIVRAVDKLKGTVDTIDGNQGPGEKVTEKKGVPIRSVTAFYSIQPLLDKKKAA